MKLILFFLFFPFYGLAQVMVSGTVVEETTGKAIAYATIGLSRENKGVTANEKGFFSISSSLSRDSLRISSVGYESQVLLISKWVNGGIISLRPKIGLLKEVVIASNLQKQVYAVNPFKHCSSNSFMTGQGPLSQLAQKFEAPKPGMQLTALVLCKDNSESVFRLRIYDYDSIEKCPSTDLVDTVIEIRSKENYVHINLENNHIIIPGRSYFVAIEWLFAPINAQVLRQKIEGKKRVLTYYKPFIKYVYSRNQKPGTLWILNYNGKWTEKTSFIDINLQITTKLM